MSFVNLPKMWQTLRNFATMEHAWGRAWRIKEGRLEENDFIFLAWLKILEISDRVEHLHASGWVVKVVFCCRNPTLKEV
jgi:hypothetical protein